MENKYDNTLHYKLFSLSRLSPSSSQVGRSVSCCSSSGAFVGFDGSDLAGDGLGLGGGVGDGVRGGDRVDAAPEPVGLSNLRMKARV